MNKSYNNNIPVSYSFVDKKLNYIFPKCKFKTDVKLLNILVMP